MVVNFIQSRALTYDELDSFVAWLEPRKSRLYSLKYLENMKRLVKKINRSYEYLNSLGIPSLAKARREAEYRIGMNPELNPNLAMEFKLTWT